MPRKKKISAAQTPASMRWEFDPDIPTHDFLEDGPLDDTSNLQQAVKAGSAHLNVFFDK